MNTTDFDITTENPTTELSTLSTVDVTTEDLNSTTPSHQTTTHLYDTYGMFIHPHWYQFPPISTEWHYAIGVYITIVGITGILGNSTVIWMFSRDRALRTPSNMFIVNLALSDLTFSIVNGFPLLALSAFNKRWIFGSIACQFYGLIGGIFGLMSINTMATIAFDRYQAIARPLHVAKTMTRKRSFLMIAGVWIWSLMWSVPPIFGWGAYIPEGFQTSCTFDYLTRTLTNRSFIICMYVFSFAVPLAVIIICYCKIVKAVRDHETEMKKTAKKLNAEMRTNQDKQKMEIRVTKIAVLILILYLLSWTPYATVALVAQFGNPNLVTPFWSEIPVMFAKASAMHNPIVYALSHPRFRAALHERLPWLMCCFKPPPTKMTHSNTQQDRNASRRSVSSYAGGVSISSEISNVSDVVTPDTDFKMREIEIRNERETTASRRNTSKKQRGGGKDGLDDIPSSQLIQDLVHALIDLSQRDQTSTQIVRPVYLPSDILQKKSAEAGKGGEDVFVLDNNTLPGLASYLAQFSMLNAGGSSAASAGITNPSLEISPVENAAPKAEGSGGERKTVPEVTTAHGQYALKADETKL